jgi:hypothetical protein
MGDRRNASRPEAQGADDELPRNRSPRYNITINITDSTVTQLNTAVEAVHTIESRLAAIGNQPLGSPKLADALHDVTQAIVDEESLGPERRADLISNAEKLSAVAAKLVKRNRWLTVLVFGMGVLEILTFFWLTGTTPR